MTLPLFFIPTRDRHRCLTRLLDAIATHIPFERVWIVDMESTFPRMLEFLAGLERIGVRVLRRPNLGARGMLRDPEVRRAIGDGPFFMSDPDVVPSNSIRPDFMQHMVRCLDRYKQFVKFGLTLRTDDLPDHFPRKQEVIDWERRFTQKQLNVHLYEAEVATTFCIVRGLRFLDNDANSDGKDARLVGCTARHTSWYLNPASMPDDERYYLDHAPRRRPGVPEPGVTWNI